jgi:hypothetical protein
LKDFNQECDKLLAGTILSQFQYAYDKGEDLLCSEECVCSASKIKALTFISF